MKSDDPKKGEKQALNSFEQDECTRIAGVLLELQDDLLDLQIRRMLGQATGEIPIFTEFLEIAIGLALDLMPIDKSGDRKIEATPLFPAPECPQRDFGRHVKTKQG